MKHLFLILTFLPFIAFSQSSSIGIKTGATYSWINTSEFGGVFGSHLGIIYSSNFNKFQLTIEPSYHVKGYSQYITPYPNGIGRPKTEEKVSYRSCNLEIPITIGFVPVNKKLILGINAGFAPAFIFYGKQTSASLKSAGPASGFNLDFIGGLKGGVNISEKLFLALNLRYGIGLLNLEESNNKGSTYSYVSPFMEFGFKF